jgi:hypothetical protein
MHPADPNAVSGAAKAQMIFGSIAQIAADLANDHANPVIATYGVEAEILAATIQGLIGLFRKK